jgi:alkylation response protein AidB-like acyl-CoA dehydrogenase
MDLSLSETQIQLEESVATFLSRLPPAPMRPQPPTVPDAAWRALANELGLLGLLVPEAQGGFGAGGPELLVVMEAMARHLFDQPFAEVAVTALSLLQVAGEDDLMSRLLAGEAMPVPVLNLVSGTIEKTAEKMTFSGETSLVFPASQATHFLVSTRCGDEDGLLLVEASQAHVRPVATIDERWAGQVTFDHASARWLLTGQAATEAIEYAEDWALAALCAEASGVLSRLLDDTVEYTKQRRQFSQPISRFQVLQHRMADMFIQYEMAKSAAVLACLSLDKPTPERRKATSAAKMVVADACRFIAQNAVQLHGGLGMSAETEMTRWFKRAIVIEYQLGSRDDHIQRYMLAA